MNVADGFYWLTRADERPCLVRVYKLPDMEEQVIGFGVWDGGTFMPLSDLKKDSTLTLAMKDPAGYL